MSTGWDQDAKHDHNMSEIWQPSLLNGVCPIRLKEEPIIDDSMGDGALATGDGAKAWESEALVGKTT